MAGNVFLVALVVCNYWLIATTMIFINKQLMSATKITLTSRNLQSDAQTGMRKYSLSVTKLKESTGFATNVQQDNDTSKDSIPHSYPQANSKIISLENRTLSLITDNKMQEASGDRKNVLKSVDKEARAGDLSQSYTNVFRRSKARKLKPRDKIERGPDISVLVVWAQSVFGLIFLLTLRGLVILLGLPVKELRHLQLPSMAHRGDLDFILAAVAQTSALIFNNLTLRLINVSFYQIARALTLVFVTILSACILRERIAKRIGIACILMLVGFYVGVDQEVVSQGVLPIGVMYGSIASFFAACYGVLFKRLQITSTTRSTSSLNSTSLVKKIWINLNQKEKELINSNKDLTQRDLLAKIPSLPPKDFYQWKYQSQEIGSTASRITATTLQFTYYNYLTCSIALAPAVLGSCQAHDFVCSEASRDANFWCLLVLSGMAGIAMSWVSSLQISLTSPLTHNISINAKSVLLTLTAVIWNGESRTGLWWTGNVLVITGVALYTASKLQEQVQLLPRGGTSGTDKQRAASRRFKVPVRLAAVVEDVRY
ncbi:GDP-fucose transporter [Elysia marginata]|uniref:GDP-fucose transporter n=1 Tax=Elysia marginata TaxID=1093978 RepID=A0AAV4F7Z6_9GAST|nr:GDP-fucose transporter [Elysia marginata]